MVRVLLLCILLSGCTTTKHVLIDVPEPPVVARPVLEVSKLQKGDTPDTVVKAHRVAIKQLQEYAVKLEVLLDAYRKK